MTREEAMQRLSDLQDGSGQTYEAIRMAIEALSSDTVSHNVYDKRTKADEEIIDSYRKEYQKAISSDAVQGEWIEHELWGNPWFTCSKCNYHGRNDFNFCPNCGAKMRGGAE